MSSDFIFVGFLVYLCCKWFSKHNGFGDWIGLIMVNLILFILCKVPGIMLTQGPRNYLVKPVEPIFFDHFISGLLSVVLVGCFYYSIHRRHVDRES